MPTNAGKNVASTLFTGLLGAGLIYYGRRSTGLLAAISATAGLSLLTKAVSSAVSTALSPSSVE